MLLANRCFKNGADTSAVSCQRRQESVLPMTLFANLVKPRIGNEYRGRFIDFRIIAIPPEKVMYIAIFVSRMMPAIRERMSRSICVSQRSLDIRILIGQQAEHGGRRLAAICRGCLIPKNVYSSLASKLHGVSSS